MGTGRFGVSTTGVVPRGTNGARDGGSGFALPGRAAVGSGRDLAAGR